MIMSRELFEDALALNEGARLLYRVDLFREIEADGWKGWENSRPGTLLMTREAFMELFGLEEMVTFENYKTDEEFWNLLTSMGW